MKLLGSIFPTDVGDVSFIPLLSKVRFMSFGVLPSSFCSIFFVMLSAVRELSLSCAKAVGEAKTASISTHKTAVNLFILFLFII